MSGAAGGLVGLLAALACGGERPTAATPSAAAGGSANAVGRATAPTADDATPTDSAPTDSAAAGARLRVGDATLAVPGECAEAQAVTYGSEPPAPDVARLPDGSRVVQVQCAPGAYQGTYVFFRVPAVTPAADVAPLVFPDVEARGDGSDAHVVSEMGTEIVGLPTLDAATGRLTVWRKFRGPGDCGVVATFDVAATPPALVALRGQLTCAEVPDEASADPDRWPTLPLPRPR